MGKVIDILRKLYQKPPVVPPTSILKVEDIPGLTDKDKLLLKRIGVTSDDLAGKLQEDLQINYERRSLYKEFDKARDHWMVGCLRYGTKIRLCNGTSIPIGAMAECSSDYIGKSVWSVNPITLRIEPDKIVQVQKTRRDADMVRVHLDNEEYVECTPDHKFMLRDGSYKEAQDLEAGQSLMPFYSWVCEKVLKGYELLYNPEDGKQHFAHWLVTGPVKRGFIRHHKDFNQMNNDPENLQIMTGSEHSEYHGKLLGGTTYHDPLTCKCMVCRYKRGEDISGKNHPAYGKPAWNKGHKIRITKVCANPDCLKKWQTGEKDPSKYCSRVCANKVITSDPVRNKKLGGTVKWQWANLNQEKRLEGVRKYGCGHKWYEGRVYPKRQVVNHKVVRVEKLLEKEDVFDITTERNHNFSLSVGIFVHNSALGLFADVVTTPNALQNCTVWITSESTKYVTELTKLLDRIGIEERIYDWAWTTGCYGDHFPKINGHPGLGVVSVEDGFHPVDISRLDYEGTLVGFYLTPQGSLGSSQDEQTLLPPWDYVHLRMLGAKKKRSIFGDPNFMEYRTIHLMAPDTRQLQPRYGMYGTSLIVDALPVWKRLRLAEDSLLMARLTRGITKYIYKVKVDSSNMESVSELIDQYVTMLKRARAIDTGVISDTPAYDSKWNAMSSMEDIILPVWGDTGDISIEKIGGETDIRWIIDITELRNQLASSLRAPVPLLGGHIEEAVGAMGGEALSKLDIRFARTARKLQRAVKEGITRMCQIHLAYMNMDPDPNLFEVNLSETSTAEDEQLRDALDKGVDVIAKYMDMFDQMALNLDKAELFDYMNQKILKLNDLDLKDYIKAEPEPTVEEFRERCFRKLRKGLDEKIGPRRAVDRASCNRDLSAALPLKETNTNVRYSNLDEWKKNYGSCKVKLTESARKKVEEKE